MTWMRRSWTTRMVAAMLASLAVLGAVTALAAANAVPATRIGQSDHPVLLQQLVPGQCAGIAGSLSNLVVDSGSFDGTNAGDLMLGSAGPDDISGRQGSDCIVGGDGNDSLNGNQGNDVLVGGGGDDDLDGGVGTSDWCFGDSGTDTERRCETVFGVP
jgi:Ca2+-binding RTX toxin-like protein